MPPPIAENEIPGDIAVFVLKEQERATEKVIGIVEKLTGEQKAETAKLTLTVNQLALSQAEALGALKLLRWSIPLGLSAVIALTIAVLTK